MPRLDRSGPSGAGPRTGGGRGLCGARQAPATGAGGDNFCGAPPSQGADGRRQRQRRRMRRYVSGADTAGETAVDPGLRAAELRKARAMFNARQKGGPPFVNRNWPVK